MGAIARSAANLITTSGVVLKGAVNNDSFDNVTALPSSFGDGITLISSQTASNSATVSFTSGLTSTYKAYKFVCSSIHPRTDGAELTFNLSTDAGSNYNVTKTTTSFTTGHGEDGLNGELAYDANGDLAQSTSFQRLTSSGGIANDADSAVSGSMILFNPSSTTYVKHFISSFNLIFLLDRSWNNYMAGYANTTSAVNAIQFKMSSGNFDGTIYLYGIK